jgi:hypothetical protein
MASALVGDILHCNGDHLLLVALAVAFTLLITLLIALLDPRHLWHQPAHGWVAGHHQL